MSELEDRLRTRLAEAATYAPPPRPAMPDGGRHLRAERVWARSAAVVTLLVIAAMAFRAVTDDRSGDVRFATGSDAKMLPLFDVSPVIHELPPSPLSPRRGHTGVWTGSEFIVWGGTSGDKVGARVLSDGGAYDPRTGTWRLLPPAPLTARSGHTAVWTGEEMVVWGGTEGKLGPEGPLDGAAYNPGTNSWRRIASSPPGTARTHGKGVWAGNRVVVGAGQEPTSGPRAARLLVFDPARDTWATVALPDPVYDIVAAGGLVATVAIPADGGQPSFAVVDPVSSQVRPLPATPALAAPDRVGLVSTGERLVAAVSGGGMTTVLAVPLPGDGGWERLGAVNSESFHPAVPVTHGFDHDFMAWLQGGVVAYTPWGLEVFDPRSGAAKGMGRTGLLEAYCGAGSASVLAGRVIIAWGGQRCIDAPSDVSTGVRLDLAP